MTIKNNGLFKTILKALDQNAPTVATFGSLLGLGLTVYFMHKASKDAAKAEETYKADVNDVESDEKAGVLNEEEAKEEKAHLKFSKSMKLVYIYRWALLSGVASGGLAVLSNWLNGRTIAGLTTMLALSSDKWQKAMPKIKEMIGEERFQKLQDDINHDILGEKYKKGDVKAEVSRRMPSEAPEEGCTRFYDPFWDDFFDIHKSVLMDAMAEAERMEFLDFNTWRNLRGMNNAKAGYHFAWSKDNPFKAHISQMDMGLEVVPIIVYDNEPEMNKCGK